MELRPRKRVAFYTLGCKVNQYDTQAMMEQFLKKDYRVVDFEEDADVYVINTCTVTNLGDRKSRQMIHRAHRRNPDAVIAVVGCYAQRASEEVLSIPGVNLVLGNQERSRIVELVEEVQRTGVPMNRVADIMKVREFEEMPIEDFEGKTRAVLKIQEGCNQFCAYCIIPYARGPVRSRRPEDVQAEVKRLVDKGYQEIVLTGIHLASYGLDLGEAKLLSLLEDLHDIEGLRRIRLGSLEPTLLTDQFIQVVKGLPKVCRHYHISLQSGCDETLRRMNRKYTTAKYREIVHHLRQQIPQVAVTTDIMVGFPGETDEEFEKTYRFVEEIAFSKIHVFQYSPRAGTPAAKMKQQVPSEKKEYRSKRLIELGETLERKYLEQFLGTEVEVLFEEEVEASPGWVQGHSDHYIRVMAPGEKELEGRILPVFIEEVGQGYAVGKIAR